MTERNRLHQKTGSSSDPPKVNFGFNFASGPLTEWNELNRVRQAGLSRAGSNVIAKRTIYHIEEEACEL